jgi:predicted enzyme related to lactoylglutathione lyase
MSETQSPKPGTIGWVDLTIENAEEIRDFYSAVVGWQPEPVDMGGYHDFSMVVASSGPAVAGVCHARGINTGLPRQWLVYITVADLDTSMKRCRDLGGVILAGPRSLGSGRFCVIQDPAGAVAALFMPGKDAHP